MSKIERTDYQESKSQSGPHKDYEYNLRTCQMFIENTNGKIPRGLKVQVRDSHHLKQSLLEISYHPPLNVRMGMFATPICLHQKSDSFKKELEDIFNRYYQMAESVIKTNAQTRLEWIDEVEYQGSLKPVKSLIAEASKHTVRSKDKIEPIKQEDPWWAFS